MAAYTKGAIYAVNPATTRGQSTKLGLDPKGEKIVYTNGRAVIIRDIKNPANSVTYQEHVKPATVARISPSGYYCASADEAGTVRIWDLAGEEQILKNEVKVVAGRINDLAWDGESKRIIAVGEGRESMGRAFTFDSGSTVGEVSGHSKPINAIAIRHQRPFRAVTASDDNTLVFYHGVPYKFNKTLKTHTRFVQDVRFSPNGDLFVSVGSDAKAFLYDGKTGDVIAELPASHSGSIMAASWSPDNRYIATSSADRTVKLWDVEARSVVQTYELGEGVGAQQVGNVWAGGAADEGEIVSLGLDGVLNVLDERVPNQVSRKIYGPPKGITAFTYTAEPSPTLLSGSFDGTLRAFDADTGNCTPVQGAGHTNQVTGIAEMAKGKVATSGLDDTVREVDVGAKSFSTATASTSALPKSISADPKGHVFAAAGSAVDILQSGKKLSSVSTPYGAASVSASGDLVAVGGEDSKVRLYTFDGSTLKESKTLENNRSTVTALAFSPDGSLLAAGESNGKIILYSRQGELKTSAWTFHTGRIHSIAWSADGKYAATGSLDTHVYIYSVEKPTKNIAIKNVAAGGVTGTAWTGANKIAVAGSDGCVRNFELKLE